MKGELEYLGIKDPEKRTRTIYKKWKLSKKDKEMVKKTYWRMEDEFI